MTAELVTRKFRRAVPDAHRATLDTRLVWLWGQRFGTLQTIWTESDDLLDRTAATMLLQAILGKDLNNIQLVFKRLEGGAQEDTAIEESVLRI